MALKVLMVGGRRCGKTAALASIFNQMQNGPTNKTLTVSDQTKNESKIDPIDGKIKTKESLIRKTLELKHFITTQGNRSFMVDEGPTNLFWDYTLRLQIPGTSHYTDMIFRDSAGEYFDNSIHQDETEKFIKDADVFVVAVDSAYLMAGKDYENQAANIADKIHTFFTDIQATHKDPKLVIFVLIKCEKWLREGKAEALSNKVEATYQSTIQFLKATGNTEMWIIPIQTAGSIEFTDLRAPYILYNTKTEEKKRCSKITNNMVSLKDGKNYTLTANDIIQEDPDSVFFETDIPRPSAWYRLTDGKKSKYEPVNCEQLPLHIVRFLFNRLMANAHGGILGKVMNFFFGTITKAEMEQALNKLASLDLIKDSGDGIRQI